MFYVLSNSSLVSHFRPYLIDNPDAEDVLRSPEQAAYVVRLRYHPCLLKLSAACSWPGHVQFFKAWWLPSPGYPFSSKVSSCWTPAIIALLSILDATRSN